MMYGRLVTWFPTRRFGFIRAEDADQEVFVHASDFNGGEPFPKGTRVKYEFGTFGGRRKAVNVNKAEAVRQ